jgi:hypothetical protein
MQHYTCGVDDMGERGGEEEFDVFYDARLDGGGIERGGKVARVRGVRGRQFLLELIAQFGENCAGGLGDDGTTCFLGEGCYLRASEKFVNGRDFAEAGGGIGLQFCGGIGRRGHG